MERIFKDVIYYIGKDGANDKYTINIPSIGRKGYFQVFKSISDSWKKGLAEAEVEAKKIILNSIKTNR